MVIMSNGEAIVVNNDYKIPMLFGEISPVLGSYIAPSGIVQQVALAWIE